MVKDKVDEQKHMVRVDNVHGMWQAFCLPKCGWRRAHPYYYELKPMIEKHYEKFENQ